MSSAINNQNRRHNSSVFLIVLCGLLVGLVIGILSYLIFNWNFTSHESSESPFFSSSNPSNTTNTGVEKATSSWIFSEELSHSDLLKLSKMLNSLNQDELLNLIEKSSTQSWTMRLYTVQEMLIENLVQISPEAAIASVVQFQHERRRLLLQVIFSHWSLVNFDRALSVTEALPRTDQQMVIEAILTERSDLNKQELTSAALRFNFESDLIAWEQERELYELLDQEPFKAIESLANDDTDDYQQIDIYRQAVEQWFQDDGLYILTTLWDLDLSRGVYAELFEQVARQDRVASLEYLYSFDLSRNESFAGQLLYSWAEENVEEAFQAVRDLPQSHHRNSLFLSVISGWGRQYPSEALDRLKEFPRLYRADALSAAAMEIANDNPLAALDRISEFRTVPGANVDRAIESVIRIWANSEPKLALVWVQNNTKEDSTYRTKLFSEVLPKFALDEPEKAMTIAVQEFNPDSNYWSLESRVINYLLYANKLDTAIELLDQVRDEIKVSEHVNVGAELVKQDRLDDALALIDSVPVEEKSEYLYRVTSRITIYDLASDVLEMIEKVPSAQLQADVAERLLTDGSAESNFTSDQLETLRSYVSD